MNVIRDNFGTAVAFLLPVDPYSKQRNNSNKNSHIADVSLKGKFQNNMGVVFAGMRRINTRN